MPEWDDHYVYCEDCGRRIVHQVSDGECPDCGGRMVGANQYDPSGVFCEVCGRQDFKNFKGVEIHKNRKHKEDNQ